MDPKRPSGNRRTTVDLCPEQQRFVCLEDDMARVLTRLGALDGNGTDAAEGGAVGRLRKSYEEIRATNRQTQWFAFATLIGMMVQLALRVISK